MFSLTHSNVILSGIFCLTFLGSCTKRNEVSVTFFDSLVSNQVAVLARARAKVEKVVRINEKSDQSTFVPDKAGWEAEFDAVRELDAFKRPAYRSAYVMRDGIRDSKSNLRIRSYHATEKVPVPSVTFYYHQRFGNLKRIEAVLSEENPLYLSSRVVQLEFEMVNDQPVLTSYSIEGVQKMMLNDTVRYAVMCSIRF